MKLLAALLAALLAVCQGAAGEGPEPELDLDRYISYIGQTGAEIREELGYGPEDWGFYDCVAGGYFFRLGGQDCLFGFSGEDMEEGDSPDPVRCVSVDVFSVWDGNITTLEERLGVTFEYSEEMNSFSAADLDRRLMFYGSYWWDGEVEGSPVLEILYMSDDNYAALQREAEEKG